jgi:hypothetical protein
VIPTLGAGTRVGDHVVMQHTPHHGGSDLDFSLVAMAVVMSIAIVFLVSQLT